MRHLYAPELEYSADVQYFAAGFCFITAIVLFIFMEETNFQRNHSTTPIVTVEQVQNEAVEKDKSVATSVAAVDNGAQRPAEVQVHAYNRIASPWPGPRPFRIFKISPHAGQLMLRGMLYPIMMLRIPIVLWCGIIFALYQVFYNSELRNHRLGG